MNWSPTSPTPEERAAAWRRLREAAPPDWVLDHALAVEALAAAMAMQAQAVGLVPHGGIVRVAALLHDIGRSLAQDVSHASRGSALLAAEGWDERVVRAVDRHTGAGIPATEAASLGLPVRDYTPRSLEERIVCHADNLHSGARRIGLAELQRKYLAKGLPAAWERIRALHDSLGRELGADLESLPAADLRPPDAIGKA